MTKAPWPKDSCNYYEELDLSDWKQLPALLDATMSNMVYDPSRHRFDRYDVGLTRAHASSRVSLETLQTVMSESPKKNIAGADQNTILLYNLRERSLEPLIKEIFQELMGSQAHGRCRSSGTIWYPANGYMGWHTNFAARGCRLYCSHAREAGRSFFRFREPGSGVIRTSWDKEGWQFRLFRINSEPLWHAVYSATDRISLGFNLAAPMPRYGRRDQEECHPNQGPDVTIQ